MWSWTRNELSSNTIPMPIWSSFLHLIFIGSKIILSRFSKILFLSTFYYLNFDKVNYISFKVFLLWFYLILPYSVWHVRSLYIMSLKNSYLLTQFHKYFNGITYFTDCFQELFCNSFDTCEILNSFVKFQSPSFVEKSYKIILSTYYNHFMKARQSSACTINE